MLTSTENWSKRGSGKTCRPMDPIQISGVSTVGTRTTAPNGLGMALGMWSVGYGPDVRKAYLPSRQHWWRRPILPGGGIAVDWEHPVGVIPGLPPPAPCATGARTRVPRPPRFDIPVWPRVGLLLSLRVARAIPYRRPLRQPKTANCNDGLMECRPDESSIDNDASGPRCTSVRTNSRQMVNTQ